MKRFSLLLTALLSVVAGCGAQDALPDPALESTLRFSGVGPVAFGNSLAETELMVGEKSRGLEGDAGCRYVEFSALPGLRFTVRDGIVVRADAGVGVRNSLGVNLGDTVDSVVYLYPDAQMRHRPGSFGDTYLILADPGGSHAFVMTAAGNKIIAIRAGLSSAVGSDQGCP
jgi:hypothetical protein